MWNKDWAVGKPWVEFSTDLQRARCTWCAAAKSSAVFATAGSANHKESVLNDHENSWSHKAVVVSRGTPEAKDFLRKQDQANFSAFESSFHIIYTMVKERVKRAKFF